MEERTEIVFITGVDFHCNRGGLREAQLIQEIVIDHVYLKLRNSSQKL